MKNGERNGPWFCTRLRRCWNMRTKRGGAVQILSKIEILNREQDWWSYRPGSVCSKWRASCALWKPLKNGKHSQKPGSVQKWAGTTVTWAKNNKWLRDQRRWHGDYSKEKFLAQSFCLTLKMLCFTDRH